MTEAIRFYWRGRAASIPLGEIPEQDRTPLTDSDEHQINSFHCWRTNPDNMLASCSASTERPSGGFAGEPTTSRTCDAC